MNTKFTVLIYKSISVYSFVSCYTLSSLQSVQRHILKSKNNSTSNLTF